MHCVYDFVHLRFAKNILSLGLNERQEDTDIHRPKKNFGE